MEKKITLSISMLLAVLNAVTMFIFAMNGSFFGVVNTPCTTILLWLVFYLLGRKAEQERIIDVLTNKEREDRE